MRNIMIWLVFPAALLGATYSHADNQQSFDQLGKELGEIAAKASAEADPKLRSQLQQQAIAKQQELAQFLTKLDVESRSQLRIHNDPLAILKERLEQGRALYAKNEDAAALAIKFCQEATAETDPLLREGKLQKAEQQIRKLGVRLTSIPDYAIIATDVTLSSDLLETFTSIAKNIRLRVYSNTILENLEAKLIAFREKLNVAQDENLVWITTQHQEFGDTLANAGLLPQGAFEGMITVSSAELVMVGNEKENMKFTEGAFTGRIKLVLKGTVATGVVSFGEEEGRSVARLHGTMNAASGKIMLHLNAPTLGAMPGVVVTQFRGLGDGTSVMASRIVGNLSLDVSLTGTWEEDGETKTSEFRFTAVGKWEADQPLPVK